MTMSEYFENKKIMNNLSGMFLKLRQRHLDNKNLLCEYAFNLF